MSTIQQPTNRSNEFTPPSEIIAKPAKYYRNTRVLMVVILFGYGLWSFRDGYYKYPRENDDARQRGLSQLPHPGLDVPFNQWLGMFLPPLSLLFLGWALYNSRGQYRFVDRTLHVPGHPPVPLTAIRTIDKTKWDRKGIAYIDYQTAGMKQMASLKIDDFVYERGPTDAIVARLDELAKPATPPLVKPPSPMPPRPPRQQIK